MKILSGELSFEIWLAGRKASTLLHSLGATGPPGCWCSSDTGHAEGWVAGQCSARRMRKEHWLLLFKGLILEPPYANVTPAASLGRWEASGSMVCLPRDPPGPGQDLPLAPGWDCSVWPFISPRHRQELTAMSRQGRQGPGSIKSQCSSDVVGVSRNPVPGPQRSSPPGLKLQGRLRRKDLSLSQRLVPSRLSQWSRRDISSLAVPWAALGTGSCWGQGGWQGQRLHRWL